MMKILLVYKILPVFVKYVSEWRYGNFTGKCFGNIILIKRSNENEIGLLEHELVHVKQFYRTLGLHGLLYRLSDKYKLKSELEAYRKTIEVKGYTNERQYEWIAESLSKDYKLNISKDEAMELLNK